MGALFGDEDFFDGGGVEGVGAEAVDGLRGDGYGVAFAQELAGEGGVGWGEPEGFALCRICLHPD